MDTLVIRKALPSDIPGICFVNRGEPGPWAEPEKCETHVLTRLKNGFYVQVAEREGQVVGHAEWIVSDAYRGKSLYLGQLQVEPTMQKQGIGRRMIEDGVHYAKENGCGFITLIPEQETGSQDFYKKCGFAKAADILRTSIPAKKGKVIGKRVQEAPHYVVKELPFVFGLTQTSAEHMWQVINRESRLTGRMVDTILGKDFCIQLAGFDKAKNALVLAWADGDIETLVHSACAFAHECGYPGADFVFFPEYEAAFPGIEAEREDFEMILKL